MNFTMMPIHGQLIKAQTTEVVRLVRFKEMVKCSNLYECFGRSNNSFESERLKVCPSKIPSKCRHPRFC